MIIDKIFVIQLEFIVMAILCLIDLIQALFDPVEFSEGIEEAYEMGTYMMFSWFLTEAEGEH